VLPDGITVKQLSALRRPFPKDACARLFLHMTSEALPYFGSSMAGYGGRHKALAWVLPPANGATLIGVSAKEVG